MEIDDQRLSVQNREEYLKIMKLYLLRVIVDIDVHLLSWLKCSLSWFDLEDLVLKDMPLKSLFIARFTWISPRLKLYFLVIRHFEAPVSSNSTDILKC